MAVARPSLAVALGVGLLGALLALAATWPAAQRELALDDARHLHDFPALNADRPLIELLALPHWQDVPGEIHWRPVPKILWRTVGVDENGTTVPLWLVSGLLAGICVGLFAATLPRRFQTLGFALTGLAPVLSPLAADVLFPFVGHSDLLAAVGVLGAWACWRRGGMVRALLGAALLALGVFSKESVYPAIVALPIALWLGDGTQRQRHRAAVRATVAGGCVLALRLGLQVVLFGGIVPGESAAAARTGEGERVVGSLEIIGRHAAALVAPHVPQTDHTFLRQPGADGGAYPMVGAAALLVWVGALAWALWPRGAARVNARRLRARRLLAAGLIWIGLTLVPYLHLTPILAVWAGRFLFLPLFGLPLLMLALWGLLPRPTRALPMVYLAAVTVWGALEITDRAADWKSPLALWQAEVDRRPDHAFAWKNLAAHLQHEGELPDALVAIRRSTELWPGFGDGWLAHGQIASAAGALEEADDAFAEAERLMPSSSEVQIERARLAARRGRLEDAEARLVRLLERWPESAEASALLDIVRRDRGTR